MRKVKKKKKTRKRQATGTCKYYKYNEEYGNSLEKRSTDPQIHLLCHPTWVLLLFAPLLLVSFNFPKEISCLIQWEPVLGDSG